MDINLLKPYANNAKLHPAKQIKMVADSIKEFGFNQPIVVDQNNEIIVGHGRYLAAKSLGLTDVPVLVKTDLTPVQVMAYRLADNKLNESDWEQNLLVAELKLIDAQGFNVELIGFDKGLIGSPAETIKEATLNLSERFIIPPISVLDTRQAYWMQRKKNWYGVGLRGGEGREAMEAVGGFTGNIPGYYSIKKREEAKIGREMSKEEFEEKFLDQMLASTTVQTTDAGGLLSVFDPVLCEVMYKWFCPTKGSILDPFSGGSTRGVVASFLDYKYYGIDLSEKQVKANQEQALKILPADKQPTWIRGNSLDMDSLLPADLKVDFIFSCPPYFDYEVYTDDPADLSNVSYEVFTKQYAEIIAKSVARLKDNRFAVFCTGEVRDEDGYYRDFNDLTKRAFVQAGAKFYNDLIIITP
ncbi:hypothetical protein EPO05_06030, partial [Patescibacteria group bacterium]